MSRRDCGILGRLPPRWLEDLLTGKLADRPADHGDLFLNCEELPDRLTLPQTASAVRDGGKKSNGHELFLQELQCVSNEEGETISCMCKHCKYHFVFDFSGTWGPHCGNGLPESPLCHLLRLGSEVRKPHDEHNKWLPVTHIAQWECSNPQCHMKISVSISKPRMKAEDVAWIVDEERIREQRRRALAQDPDRFANLKEDLEQKSLITLNAYLRDCLQQSTSSEPKKVATRNKIFVVQFGESSLPIFQDLGFEINVIDGEEYLMLPRPDEVPGNTPIGSRRAYYEDLRHEVLTLVDESGREQVKEKLPAKARLERSLSCYNHGVAAPAKQQDDPADLQLLGVAANCSDSILKFAYECQVQTNPDKRKDCCMALHRLSCYRGDDLQMFATLQMSMEETTTKPTTDPLKQAYAHIGVPPDVQDESTIIASYKQLFIQDPDRKKLHRRMLLRIGKSLGSTLIQGLACDMPDYKEACQFLEISEEIEKSSVDVLLSFIETQIRDGKEQELVAAALNTIADKIDNAEMKERAKYYASGYYDDEPMVEEVREIIAEVNPNLPIGLDNLRNTCYLNSILQYFYTVKGVRSTVLNFDPENVPLLTEASQSDGEVYLGREFMLELKKLFIKLNSTSTGFVKPEQRLANAAWISADNVKQDKERATVGTSTPNNQHTARPLPPLPSDKTETKPTVTVEPVSEHSDTASISSSQTLTNQPDASPNSCSSEKMDVDSGAAGATLETEKSSADPLGGTEISSVEVLIGALKDALGQTEIMGTDQMDVEEVMGRCINHLRAAVNPASVTNTNGAGVPEDEIMKTLYITFTNSRKEKGAPKYNRHTSQERWVTANPAVSGSLHLYEALDGYFEREFIGNKLISFTSIVKAPPILHICIQRSQVGGGKNTNPVEIPEVIYLDRYMDSEEDSALFQARKRGWDIKSHLKNTEQHGDSNGTESLKKLGRALSGPAEAAYEDGFQMINPRLRDLLDEFGNPVPTASGTTPPELTDSSDDDDAKDIEGLYRESATMLGGAMLTQQEDLRTELAGLFAEMKEHKYCLHSVICHAGQTAKSGHYWVWIFDFEEQIWRKYNDRTVTEEADTQAVLKELSTKGEPYYLMYVRDEDKNDLVSIPRPGRCTESDANAAAAPTTDTDMSDADDPGFEHIEHAG